MRIIVRSPETHPRFDYREMGEGARFENPDAIETIGRDLLYSVRTQSLTEDLEAEETSTKPDGTR